jgi:hypothetical protein
MPDPDDVGRRLQKYFDEASDEDFLRTLRSVTTDSEWEELTRNRPRARQSMLGHLRLALRKIVSSLRPKPVEASHSDRP